MGGRQKGTLNKVSALLIDAIFEAVDTAGGKEGLVGYLGPYKLARPGHPHGIVGETSAVSDQFAAEVTQGVAKVTADIMTSEEWAKQWVERTAHRVTRGGRDLLREIRVALREQADMLRRIE